MKVRKTVSTSPSVPACWSAPRCAPGSGLGAGAERAIHIEVVTHGQASDPFWSIFVNGVNQAAEDMAPTA